jgi:hypothetical protein
VWGLWRGNEGVGGGERRGRMGEGGGGRGKRSGQGCRRRGRGFEAGERRGGRPWAVPRRERAAGFGYASVAVVGLCIPEQLVHKPRRRPRALYKTAVVAAGRWLRPNRRCHEAAARGPSSSRRNQRGPAGRAACARVFCTRPGCRERDPRASLSYPQGRACRPRRPAVKALQTRRSDPAQPGTDPGSLSGWAAPVPAHTCPAPTSTLPVSPPCPAYVRTHAHPPPKKVPPRAPRRSTHPPPPPAALPSGPRRRAQTRSA